MKIWVIFTAFVCCNLTAQEKIVRFEGFGVNKKYGLVDHTTSTEIIPPQYNHIVFDFDDYVVLKQKNEVDFYSKETGEKLSFTTSNQFPVLINNLNYYHYQDVAYSYLIPKNVLDRIKLSKKYLGVFTEDKYIIAFANSFFDVYDGTNMNVPKIANIKASNYHSYPVYFEKINNLNTVHVFYCLGNIYVYNHELALLKTYKNNTKEHNKMLSILQKDFPSAETKPYELTTHTLPPTWKYTYEKGITKVSLFKDPKKYFFLAKKCEAQLVSGNDDWVEIQILEPKITYQFRVDFENKLFYLPAKYIQELGLKFEN